jgi:hypothetical protein
LFPVNRVVIVPSKSTVPSKFAVWLVVNIPPSATENAPSTSMPPSALIKPVAVIVPPSAIVNTGVLLSSATNILDALAALSKVRTVPAASVVRVVLLMYQSHFLLNLD